MNDKNHHLFQWIDGKKTVFQFCQHGLAGTFEQKPTFCGLIIQYATLKLGLSSGRIWRLS